MALTALPRPEAFLDGVPSSTEVRHFLEAAGMDAGSVLASGRGGYQLQLPRGSTHRPKSGSAYVVFGSPAASRR